MLPPATDLRHKCRMRHRRITQRFHRALFRQRYNAGFTNHIIVQVATSMQLQVRDWVRTTEDKIGRIASVNVDAMTARIEALDDRHQGVVVLTFPLAELVKIEVKHIIS
jgi:hypothetical protein